MRFRELTYNDCPRTVLMDTTHVLFTSHQKKFCLETLSHPETKTDTRQLLVYFRHFDRSTFALSPLVEFTTSTKPDLSDLCDAAASHFGSHTSTVSVVSFFHIHISVRIIGG
jgi:hypothetical protein